MNPETGNWTTSTAPPVAQQSLVPGEMIQVEGTRGASAPQTHRRQRDLVFECLFMVQTLEPYAAGTALTSSERAKLNTAVHQVRDAGYTVDDLHAAIRGWPVAMGDARITALGLVANLRRCMNAARGARAAHRMTDVERALAALEEDG